MYPGGSSVSIPIMRRPWSDTYLTVIKSKVSKLSSFRKIEKGDLHGRLDMPWGRWAASASRTIESK